MQAKRHPVDADVFEALSPYLRDHINRLGSYLPDLQRKVPPLDPKIDFDFAFKSAASVNFGENFCESRPTLLFDLAADTAQCGTRSAGGSMRWW